MNSKSRTENSIRNILTGFLGQFITMLAGFLCRMVFVRCLSEAYLGANGLFTSILSALNLAELGIGSAIGYELYKGLANHDEDEVAAYVQLYGKAYKIIAVIIGSVGVALIPVLPLLVKSDGGIQDNLTIIYLLYLLNTVISYPVGYKSAVITADQKDYVLKIINNITIICMDVIQAVVLLLTHNFILYLVCQVIATGASSVIEARIAERDYPFIKNKNVKKLSDKQKKNLFINVKALVISKLGSYMVNGTDSIIISALNGLSATGLVSNFTLLTSSLNNIIMQFVFGISASVGNLNAAESTEKTKSVFWEMNLFYFWLYGWASVALVVLGNDIVTLFFGETYTVSTTIIIIIAINFYTAGVMNTSWTFKNAMGLFRYGQYINFLMGIINIIVSIFLGRRYGVAGILAATSISRMSTDYWYSPYAVFKYGFRDRFIKYVAKYIKQIITVITATSILYVICSFIHLSFYGTLIIKLFLCIVVPHIIFSVLWCRTTEFWQLINRMRAIVNKIKR